MMKLLIYYLAPSIGVKYCSKHVCMSVLESPQSRRTNHFSNTVADRELSTLQFPFTSAFRAVSPTPSGVNSSIGCVCLYLCLLVYLKKIFQTSENFLYMMAWASSKDNAICYVLCG